MKYVPRHADGDPERDAGYPPYVVTLEEKRRWDVCEEVAEALFADLDEGERRAQIWSTIRALYSSDIRTGDESERLG
jgi:hypothetical protein